MKTRSREVNFTEGCDYEDTLALILNDTETQDNENCTVQWSTQWSNWTVCDPDTCTRTRNRTGENGLCISNSSCKAKTGDCRAGREIHFLQTTQQPETNQIPSSAPSSVIAILVIVLLLGLAAFGFKFRTKIQEVYLTSTGSRRDHPGQTGGRDRLSLAPLSANNNTILFTKDHTLKTEITTLLERSPQPDLFAEFARIERQAKRESEVRPKMNFEEEHMAHNRYRDMVAYEDNVISLSSEQGIKPKPFVGLSFYACL